ncbi:MAG: gephyrin-like molybdotransferase Glp [Lachnospiraceae bacterium]|nr:gephyrin-like molybdotransferase Glp [Lachnospiraceae bacterium]
MTKEYVTYVEAQKRIRENVHPLPGVSMRLEQLRGDILLENVYAPINQPPFPRSPLDGYAVRGSDTEHASPDRPVMMEVVGRVYAGSSETPSMKADQCVRIMTGGRIPPDADAVIRQEDTDGGEEIVKIYKGVHAWQNYCYEGEDFHKGDLLIEEGTVLDFTAVSLLAGSGVSQVKVPKRPRVTLISTGDELRPLDSPLPPGHIYDSNLYGLGARLCELGISHQSLHIGDHADPVRMMVMSALADSDFVITTGGVSVGQKDILVNVLEELLEDENHSYEEIFYGLQMKPGSPSKLVMVDGKPLLCLSGNPFAAIAVFELVGREILAALTERPLPMKQGKAVLRGSFPKSSRGERFLRTRITRGDVTGGLVAEISEANSSGQIRSMLGCNGFVDIPAGSGPLTDGQEVSVLY